MKSQRREEWHLKADVFTLTIAVQPENDGVHILRLNGDGQQPEKAKNGAEQLPHSACALSFWQRHLPT